jgi:hypothetical protein
MALRPLGNLYRGFSFLDGFSKSIKNSQKQETQWRRAFFVYPLGNLKVIKCFFIIIDKKTTGILVAVVSGAGETGQLVSLSILPL